MTIGQMIYSRRKQLGLTLEDVGNAVGVGKSTVKKWEDGYISNMKRDKIALLAKALEIPVEYLLDQESNSDLKVTVGDRIKEARLKKGYSQTELAKLLGYESRSSINKIEKEGRDIPRSSILKFADVLDVTPSYLMGWEDNSAIELTVSAANIDRIKAQILSIEQKLSELKEAVEELEKMNLEVEIS